MKIKLSSRTELLLLVIITAVARIPFIFDGYGVEEDSWGLVVNAYQMKMSGHYLASRFPGHPLQEYAYRLIYDCPAWTYNSLSLLMSVIAVAFFYLALKKMQLPKAFPAALAFSFVPVFYISGTYTIDFAWSMAFILASFYFLLDYKFFISGILIGMATSCRITSEIFILPWALLLFSRLDYKNWLKNVLLVSIPAVLVGALWYIPAYLQYGPAFFDYSDQFPYPPVAKVLYKASLGVFGFLGIVAIAVFIFPALKNWRKENLQPVTLFSTQRLLWCCTLIVVLQLVSYLRLPQKSGYLVPVIPFVILFFAAALNEKKFNRFFILILLSPFLFSINLTDSLRGSEHSAAAITFHSAGQEIFFDPVNGPIFSERSKRLNKMAYCNEVFGELQQMQKPALVICGWWYNELYTPVIGNMHKQKRLMPSVKISFYETCSVLDSAKKSGAEIYYLPEQDLYNDQMFGQNCTDSLAQPFPVR